MRCILKADRTTCSQAMRNKLGLLSLYNRRRFLRFILIFKIVQNQQCPEKLVAYLPRRNSMHNKCLRGSTLLNLPKARTATCQSTFQYSAARDWNRLPRQITDYTSLNSFKNDLYYFFIDSNKFCECHKCSL